MKPTPTTATAGSTGPGGALWTSCQPVLHFGDSTSAGFISSDYLPDPTQRMAAQYARVGVRHSVLDITPVTSIVETPRATTDAHTLAHGLRQGDTRDAG